MKRANGKSHCTVNFALEAIGDPWSLLIVRDIVFNDKHTYKEFLASDEKIATNILVDRLSRLEQYKIITKHANPNDRRAAIYQLTEKGIDLIPAILELSKWSFKYDPLSDASKELASQYDKDPSKTTKMIQDSVRSSRAV